MVLKILRRYGANLNLECMSESKQRMRPLQYAVYRGNAQVYQFILDENADELASQYESQMPLTGSGLLHLAAFKGDVTICKDLLNNRNLNPYKQNKAGDTCIHIAIRRNRFDFVNEVILWSVANNITCAQAELENQVESYTPFMTAVLRQNFDIANLLLKNGLATQGYVNREGRDARQISADRNRHRSVTQNCIAFLDNGEMPSDKTTTKRDDSVDSIMVTSPEQKKHSLKKRSNQQLVGGQRKSSLDTKSVLLMQRDQAIVS